LIRLQLHIEVTSLVMVIMKFIQDV